MRPIQFHLASLVLLAATAATGTARADAIADFRAGGRMMVVTATVDLGNGPRSATGGDVGEKPAGSLDLTLRAADLGVDLPITLHLRGAERHGRIEYVIEEAYSPRINLGGEQLLSSVTGRVYLHAARLSGHERQDLGNVRLTIAAGSYLVARGTWGSVRTAITRLDVLGGIPQPALDSFRDRSEGMICSSKGVTEHVFSLSLAGEARGGGASIELTTARDAGVRLPAGVVVNAGRQSVAVTARIEPKFVGRVRLTAAAGGVVRDLDIAVHAPDDCAR